MFVFDRKNEVLGENKFLNFLKASKSVVRPYNVFYRGLPRP